MSESTMRGNVVKWLSDLDAFAVENPALPGTPDVNYIGGDIELKELDEWPVLDATPVRIEHYTPQQRIRARKRWRKGGNTFWLLKVKQDWVLLDGIVAAELYDDGKAPTRATLFEKAKKTWSGRMSGVKDELRDYLFRKDSSARVRGS